MDCLAIEFIYRPRPHSTPSFTDTYDRLLRLGATPLSSLYLLMLVLVALPPAYVGLIYLYYALEKISRTRPHRFTDAMKQKPSRLISNPYLLRYTSPYINGLIRQYLPKGISLRNLPKETIAKIINRLNNRPRKCLGFKTPAEVFQQLSGINYNLETSVAF